MNGAQGPALDRLMAERAGMYLYAFDPARNAYVIHAPDTQGGHVVAVLTGPPHAAETIDLADAMTGALNRRLARRLRGVNG